MKTDTMGLEEFFDLMESLVENPDLLIKLPDRMIFAKDYETLSKVISPKRIELLRAINKHEGLTVGKLANLLNRKQEAVSRDLRTLKEMGIITVEKSGRKRIPHVEKQYIVVPLV